MRCQAQGHAVSPLGIALACTTHCAVQQVMIKQQLALQALRRRMRQGQRPPSRFQTQSVESQAQAGPDTSQAAPPDGDDDAASDTAMRSSLAAWELPDLLALLKQAMHLPTCNAVCN